MSVPVYDQLRALILGDEFGPYTMLVETSLAARLGVSRTPIREALRRLEQDGLVERTSRGTRVVVIRAVASVAVAVMVDAVAVVAADVVRVVRAMAIFSASRATLPKKSFSLTVPPKW